MTMMRSFRSMGSGHAVRLLVAWGRWVLRGGIARGAGSYSPRIVRIVGCGRSRTVCDFYYSRAVGARTAGDLPR